MSQHNLEDMLDRLYTSRSTRRNSDAIMAIIPPVGPRTLGSEDEQWTHECGVLFNIDRAVEDSQRRRVGVTDVNDLMVAIAAQAYDPTLVFLDDKADLTLKWVTGTLKPAFQSTRVPFKKPWPEFLAALLNPSCLSCEDCSTLCTLFGVQVGHIGALGDIVIPQSLLDADLTRLLIDARTSSQTTLGALLTEARQRCPTSTDTRAQTMPGLRKQAAMLAVCSKHDTRAVLASRLASRQAALDQYEDQNQSPTSN